PSQLLQDVQRQTSAEAILFSSLSTFQPYPPLRIGIKLTLVRVHDGAVLWQFDDGFNAGEASTLNDARKYLRESMGIETDPPPALSVDSPQRFIRYGVSRAVRLLKRDFQPATTPPLPYPLVCGPFTLSDSNLIPAIFTTAIFAGEKGAPRDAVVLNAAAAIAAYDARFELNLHAMSGGKNLKAIR
ncbi:MAG: hypothetical protein WCJ10_07880, partial [Opitutaceae bacterium]